MTVLRKIAVPAAVVAIGVPFTTFWEGLRTSPYKDVVGVWTVCVGETNVPMKTYTVAECRDMFADSWALYYGAVVQCFPNIKTAPPSVQAMATDLAYNVGVPTVCHSKTTGGHLKAGRWREFCESLASWTKAGGKRVQGLVNRRYAADYNSRDVCLDGLP